MGLAEYIVEMTQNAARAASRDREPAVLIGTVTGVNPLRIRIADKYEIDEDFMIIGSLCRRTILKTPTGETSAHLHEIDDDTEYAAVTVSGTMGEAAETAPGHKHSIKIKTKTALPEYLAWRGLRIDDQVIVIRFGGSMHYVMERVGGITNDGSTAGDNGKVKGPEKEEQK